MPLLACGVFNLTCHCIKSGQVLFLDSWPNHGGGVTKGIRSEKVAPVQLFEDTWRIDIFLRRHYKKRSKIERRRCLQIQGAAIELMPRGAAP